MHVKTILGKFMAKLVKTKMINNLAVIHIHKQRNIFYAATASLFSILQF